MIFCSLQLHSPESILLIVCGIGFGTGVYLFLHGFRLRRRLSFATPALKIPGNFSDGSSLAEQAIARASHTSPAQVIHLSTDASPTKAADMTQQQKIAAALMKAGVTNPATWVTGLAHQEGRVSVRPVDTGANRHLADPPNGDDPGGPQDGAPNGFEPHPPVVLTKGSSKDETFLISCHSEQDLARSLKWKSTLMIWGGSALAILCLYLLLNITHLLRGAPFF